MSWQFGYWKVYLKVRTTQSGKLLEFLYRASDIIVDEISSSKFLERGANCSRFFFFFLFKPSCYAYRLRPTGMIYYRVLFFFCDSFEWWRKYERKKKNWDKSLIIFFFSPVFFSAPLLYAYRCTNASSRLKRLSHAKTPANRTDTLFVARIHRYSYVFVPSKNAHQIPSELG